MATHDQLEKRVQATLNAALTLFSAGEFEQVILLLEKTLSIAPEEAEIRAFLGHAYQTRGDYKAAEKSFRRALQIAPDNYEASQGLGLLLLQQQRVGEAKPYLEKCLRLHPGDASTLKAYVPVLLDAEEEEKAERLFQQGWQAEPSLELAIEYTRFLIHLNKLDQAIAFIEQALAALSLLPPERIRLLAEKALVYTVKGEHSKVVEVLQEALSLDENFDRGWRGLAFSYLRLGEKEKALAASERALSINPGHYRNWQARADVLLAVRRTEEALEAAQRGLELAPPDDLEAQPVRAVLYIQKATALTIKGQIKEAIDVFAEAREEFPKDWRFYSYPLQLLLLHQGDLEGALNLLQVARSHFDLKEKMDHLISLGLRLYPNQSKRLYRWLQALYEIDGENVRLLNALGYVAVGEGQFAVAEEQWQKALSLAKVPEDKGVTLADLLYLYLLQGQWDRANQIVEEADSLMEQVDDTEPFLRVAFFHKGRIIPDYAPHPQRLLPLKAGFIANRVTLGLAQGETSRAEHMLTVLHSLLGKQSPLLWELRGTLYAARGASEEAIAAWEKALTLLAKQPNAPQEEKLMLEDWIAGEQDT